MALSEEMDRAEASTAGQLLRKKGLEHEAVYLQRLSRPAQALARPPRPLDVSAVLSPYAASGRNTSAGRCGRKQGALCPRQLAQRHGFFTAQPFGK